MPTWREGLGADSTKPESPAGRTGTRRRWLRAFYLPDPCLLLSLALPRRRTTYFNSADSAPPCPAEATTCLFVLLLVRAIRLLYPHPLYDALLSGLGPVPCVHLRVQRHPHHLRSSRPAVLLSFELGLGSAISRATLDSLARRESAAAPALATSLATTDPTLLKRDGFTDFLSEVKSVFSLQKRTLSSDLLRLSETLTPSANASLMVFQLFLLLLPIAASRRCWSDGRLFS